MTDTTEQKALALVNEELIEELARAICEADKGYWFPEPSFTNAMFRKLARAILPIIRRRELEAGEKVKQEAKEVIITGLGLTHTRLLERTRALDVAAIIGDNHD